MDQFAGDIAAVLELALIGSGLVVLYFALKEKSKLLRAAAAVMVIGGVLALICTGYWWFRYHAAGVFNAPMVRTLHIEHHDDAATHHYPPDIE